MNLSALRVPSLVVVMFAFANVGVGQEDEQTSKEPRSPVSLQDSLRGKSWATLSLDQGGYQLRLLTDDEKNEAEKVVGQYRSSRGRGSGDQPWSEDYRSMASDVRGGRFYKVRRLGADAIELKGDTLHAVMPMASIRVVLLGPAGNLGSPGRHERSSGSRFSSTSFPAPQEFIQTLRGGGGSSGLSGGRGGVGRGSSTGATGGLLGTVVKTQKESAGQPPSPKPVVFFLKYAEASSVLEIIDELYGRFEIRIAAEPRLNAVVVQCELNIIEQIEQLIESLDRQSPMEEEPDEAPMLRTYSVDDVDGDLVLSVLQTMLAGRPEVRLTVDNTNNRVVVLGLKADHETIEETIKQLRPKN